MTRVGLLLVIVVTLLGLQQTRAETPWQLALPGWQYRFPQDHGPHPGFKTEWWYFTGNVVSQDGQRFGYQLTFFRQGIRPPAERGQTKSRFVVDDLKFAHFAVSDPQSGRFRATQKLSRGAFGDAGFGAAPGPLAWIDDWKLTAAEDSSWSIVARAGDASLSFKLVAAKPWVIQGVNGLSQKADGEGHASHYYSGTRLQTSGELTLGERRMAVKGTSWFDHEWASNQLTAEQLGWNWFSMHFDDGTELMLYQMRLRDGGIDPNSSGTFVAADGTSRHLKREDYRLTPGRTWASKATGARYPVAWTIEIPSLNFRAEVSTPLDSQELVLSPVAYWEGMIDAQGTREGHALKGEGYLEMTGYSGPLVGLTK